MNTLQINEHSRNASGVLPVTHDYNHWLLQLVSVFIYAYISSYAHHREHLKAFANSCKHYKINEHSRNTSGGTFGNFGPLSLTTSSFKRTFISNARYREHLKAFANLWTL